jgi:hypothetical protein
MLKPYTFNKLHGMLFSQSKGQGLAKNILTTHHPF